MAEVFLGNNCFGFFDIAYQQISETAIGTKIANLYACIYMEEVETEFLRTQTFKLDYNSGTLTIYFLNGKMEKNN